MQLKLSRSQRSAGILSKSVMFMLDARLDLTAEEASNVQKYKLGEEVIYNSAASRKHLEGAAEAALRETAGSFVSQLARTAMHRLSLTSPSMGSPKASTSSVRILTSSLLLRTRSSRRHVPLGPTSKSPRPSTVENW
jgi:hypothetical protein